MSPGTRAISVGDTLDQRARDSGHYSTVSAAEMRTGLARVLDIATGEERKAA